MNCEQANQIDLVDYLHALGYDPKKNKAADYWFNSPFREEKEASFKVDRGKNVWYDHGLGKGGRLVDFATEYYRTNVSDALEKISFFHQQKGVQNIIERPPFHSHENPLFNAADQEPAIKIIAAKQPIQDLVLCRYLNLIIPHKGVQNFHGKGVQDSTAKVYKTV